MVKPFVEGAMVKDVFDDAAMILVWKNSHIKISNL